MSGFIILILPIFSNVACVNTLLPTSAPLVKATTFWKKKVDCRVLSPDCQKQCFGLVAWF